MKQLTYNLLLLGAAGTFFILSSKPLISQSDCRWAAGLDFDHFWGQTHLAKPLAQYFSELEDQPNWSDILFSKGVEKSLSPTTEGRDEGLEAQQLLAFFSSNFDETPENCVGIPVATDSQQVTYWIVDNPDLIKDVIQPKELGQFFFTRPNRTTKLNYCSEQLFIQSWQCWTSFRKLAQTTLLEGASVLVRTPNDEVRHYEWIHLSNLSKEWDLNH